MAPLCAVISLFPSFFFCLAAATCYNPEGREVTQPEFQPCASTLGTDSMCCATNRTSEDTDKCLSNGLCYDPCTSTGDCSDTSIGEYWREFCTDPSWKSPFCLQGVCMDDSNGGSSNWTAGMSPCAMDGSWCCVGELTSDECCTMENRVVLAATVGITSTSFTSTSSTPTYSIPHSEPPPSSITSPTTTSALTPTASHSNTIKKVGLGTGIGIGVGTGIFVIVSILIAYFVLQRKKQSQNRKIPNGPESDATFLGELQYFSINHQAVTTSIHQQNETTAAAGHVSEVP